jgi:redox-sensitive bicupin YhaK (pirin superfamily)
VDPFLLFDHMGPVNWKPGEALGAPDHPHRGFETVTYLLEGRMRHRDSAGHAGDLTPGDVQWMTAGGGVVHSELPHPDFLAKGGVMNGFQVWVNLPAKDKMMKPRYQEIPAAKIPVGRSDDGLTEVRVVAGESLGKKAVIETRTPISYLHFTMKPGARHAQPVAAGHNAFIYVIKGEGKAEGRALREGQLALLGPGESVRLETGSNWSFLLLAGKPLGEPVARYGPFVMNTTEEIERAFEDYRSGKLGAVAGSAAQKETAQASLKERLGGS